MVVNCIQEQWSPIDLALQCTGPIHYKKNGWGFFLLSCSVAFLFFLHKFARPSFTCAWSKAQSTAWLALTGPSLPGNGKELGNTRAGVSHHPQLPGRALPRAAAAAPAQSKHCPGGSWKALMTIRVIDVPITAASSAALRLHPAGSSPPSWHQCQTEHPQRASTFSCVSWSPQEAAALSLQAPGH